MFRIVIPRIVLPVPTERQGVTLGLFGLTAGMLLMAREDPRLWNVKLFEVLIQAVILTGLLNMVTAFHFAANKSDEMKANNTSKALDTIGKAIDASPSMDAPQQVQVVNTTDAPVPVESQS